MNQLINEIKSIISGEKKLSKNYAWILFLCGILLFVIFMPTKEPKWELNREKTETKEQEYTADKEGKQKELADFLTSIEGVGECRVLLCMEQSQEGMFHQQEKITGVLVAASGAKNGAVKAMIVESVMALYGLEANKIEVFPIKK